MCRSIKILFNFSPPATEEEVRAASLQFMRKLSGFSSPSRANRAAFEQAVDEVAASARTLFGALVTSGEPRDREIEAERARAKAAVRYFAGWQHHLHRRSLSRRHDNAICRFRGAPVAK
jgi:hypothetical protein